MFICNELCLCRTEVAFLMYFSNPVQLLVNRDAYKKIMIPSLIA